MRNRQQRIAPIVVLTAFNSVIWSNVRVMPKTMAYLVNLSASTT